MRTEVILRLRFFMVLAFLAMPANSLGFIGNDLVPGACALACGRGGGIVNFQFPGEVLKKYVTGPSVDELDKRLTEQRKKLVDESAEKLGQVLAEKGKVFIDDFDAKLTDQRQQLRTDVERIVNEGVRELDGVLKRNIELTTEELEKQQGWLTGGLLHSFVILSRLLLYVAAVAVIMAVVAYLFAGRGGAKSLNIALAKLPTLAVVAAALFVMAYVASAALGKYVIGLQEKAYCKAYENGDLNAWAYYAQQLKILAPGDVGLNDEAVIAVTVRDWILRPSNLDGGISNSTLKQFLDYQERRVYEGRGRNPDVDSLLALMIWRRGDDRVSEHIAAWYAASAVDPKNTVPHCSGGAKALTWSVARSVLDAYLMFPVQDGEWRVLLGDAGELSGQFHAANPDGVAAKLAAIAMRLKLPPRGLKELQQISDSTRLFGDGQSKAEVDLSNFKRRLREAQLYGMEFYARTLLLHASAVAEADSTKRSKLLELRNRAAEDARVIWKELFDDFLKSSEIPKAVAISRAMHVLGGRAQSLKLPTDILADAGRDDVKNVCYVRRKWMPSIYESNVFDLHLKEAFDKGLSRIAGLAVKVESSLRFEQQSRAFFALEQLLLRGVAPDGTEDFYCGSEARPSEILLNVQDPRLTRELISEGRIVIPALERIKMSKEAREDLIDSSREAAAVLGIFVCKDIEDPQKCRDTSNWIPLAKAIENRFISGRDDMSCSKSYYRCEQYRRAMGQRVSLPY